MLPTKFVISQRLSILARSDWPAVTAATFPVLNVDEVTLEVERAAVSVDGDLQLVRGMVGQPLVSGWNATDFSQTFRI